MVVDTPNLEGEAQASASFATKIEQKIMNDALQFLNIPPQGETDPNASLNKDLQTEESLAEGNGTKENVENSRGDKKESTSENTGKNSSKNTKESDSTATGESEVVKRIPDTDEKVEDEGEVPDELPSTAESTEAGGRR